MIAGATLGAAVDFVPGSVVAQPMEKKGTTPYVTHFIFRPLMSIDIPGLGTATNLEAVGTTQNMKGEKMLDKMSAMRRAERGVRRQEIHRRRLRVNRRRR